MTRLGGRGVVRGGVVFQLAALLGLGGCSLFNPMPESVPLHHAVGTSGDLSAGAATVSITPQAEVWMGGYDLMRTSEGVHDSLYARALVLKRGELELALVAVDLVGIQRQDILWIKEELEQSIDPRHLVIASTHNHSGPDTLGIWGLPPFVSGVDEDYMEYLKGGILEALRLARKRLRPAEVGYGAVRVEAEGFMRNMRREEMVDREVVVLHVRETNGGPTIATVTELACHPEVLGRQNVQITSDFPYWTRARLEQEVGGVAIYVSGALGGLVTPAIDRADPEERDEWVLAERMGVRLAEHALEALGAIASYDPAPQIAVWHSPLYLANRNLSYEIIRWTGLLNRDRFRGGYFLTEVNLWQVGDFRLATVPGEITPDLGLRIKRNAGGRPTMVVGLANDELGYLLPEAEYDLPIYSYERGLCPGYDSADRLVRRLQDLAILSGVEQNDSAAP